MPPVDNLWKYTAMGFDLVAFSGGKGIRGPQSAGLLLGTKALIAAARQNGSPNGNAIGRGMKVNKEEMVGHAGGARAVRARKDHAREGREFERRAEEIRRSAAAVPGVKAEIFVPEVANHVPHVRVTWDAAIQGPTAAASRPRPAGRGAVDRDQDRGGRARRRRLDDAARRGEDRCPPFAAGTRKARIGHCRRLR